MKLLLAGALLAVLSTPVMAAKPTTRVPAPLRAAVTGCWSLPGGQTMTIRNAKRGGLVARLELAQPWRGTRHWPSTVQYQADGAYLYVTIPARNHGPVYLAFVADGGSLKATSWTLHGRTYRAASRFALTRCPPDP